ncbi:MAG: endonuclease/exonuclease/phosphatase family protein [Candidatus Aminicenantia bacterium]
MAKAFSLASWNVEHFKGEKERAARVIEFLKNQAPDIFALYEVEGKEVFNYLVDQIPSYQFHITEGPQVQEVLVGVKRNFTAFFTQKVEFKSGIKALRPGALLTLSLEGVNYSILFLHTKSSSLPLGLGLRDDQFRRAFKFKKRLDKIAGGKGKANFMFLGDLNTMGMSYPFDRDIDPKFELKKLDKGAKKVKMRRLTKNRAYTWWNGPGSRYKPGDFDQVVASEQLKIEQFDGADIDVRGWPAFESESDQAEWIKKYSDHGLLYLVVKKLDE